MPFAGYRDHADCVRRNADKADPNAYCATLERVTRSQRALELGSRPAGSAEAVRRPGLTPRQ
jgi:hypothetical protein